MSKTIKLDLGEQRLLSLASRMVDDHNLMGALRLLNKNAEIRGNSENSYMLYAEIFDDMQLYEKSVNCWFKYLDCSNSPSLEDAYEGLAVCYMNMGNEHFAAYYYNKLMQETGDIPFESRDQIIKSIIPPESSHLRFVYPPKLCDYTKEITEGIEYMRSNDFESAINSFDKVHEESDKYLAARNYIAMCKIITDKAEEAEQECLSLLKRDPDNIQALTTLAAVKAEQKKYDESRRLAYRLLAVEPKSTDEIYKTATVCCENKMHEEAYSLFLKLNKELGYDCTVLYFTAVAAYNSGRAEESLNAFKKLLTIYPNAVTARYYYDEIKKSSQNRQAEPLSYFYRLPEKQKLDSLKILSVLCALSKKEASRLSRTVDVSQIIGWAFDEGDVREESELQFVASACAVRVRYDDIVRSVLLNAFLSDGLKLHVLTELALRNEDNRFGVVVCNILKSVETHKLTLGRAKKSRFIEAYSKLFSRFAILEERYGNRIAVACERLYSALSENDALPLAADVKSLTAAIYIYSGINDAGINKKNVYSVFEADKKTAQLILSYIQ